MRDSQVGASIVAGDPGGLGQAYDRYASPLYKYCQSMLTDPADAADAVQDTLLITAARLDGLQDPELPRAWMYAVARNECLRILRASRSAARLAEAPDVTDEGGRDGDEAERAGLHTLFDDAVKGLNQAAREAIELQLRQGLEPDEVAAVLGVSRNHAHSLLSRARDQLQSCLGVLLVGRAGRGDCRDLDGLLADWDGQLTPLVRRRVHRHIERCPVCTARRAFELRPAMLLGLSPGAAIVAAAAESLHRAAGPPAALRARTLALASGGGHSAAAHRAVVLGRTGPFGRLGFPRPRRTPDFGPPDVAPGAWLHSGRGQAAMAVGAVLAVAITTAGLALGGNGRAMLGGGKPPLSASAASSGAATGPGTTGPAVSRPPGKAANPASSAATTPAPATAGSPTGSAPATPPAPTTPATPTASPTLSRSPAPSPSPSPSLSPSPGTLQVSPPGGQLTVPGGGGTTITLTARGGPVGWSITVSAGNGHVAVLPSGGTLRPGASTTVTIQASRSATGRELTVKPGGAVFTLATGAGNSQLAANLGRATSAVNPRGAAFTDYRQSSMPGALVAARRNRNRYAQCGLNVTKVTKAPLR
jgi:RNA polymerase sigma factor (sigma-70 family)